MIRLRWTGTVTIALIGGVLPVVTVTRRLMMTWMIGGLEHSFLFSHILEISSSQLTFIFFRGVDEWKVMDLASHGGFQFATGVPLQLAGWLISWKKCPIVRNG